VSDDPLAWSNLSRRRRAVVVAALMALLAAVAAVAYTAFSSAIPTFHNPNFVDEIFESRVVLGASRVGLVAAAAYVLISIVALISRGQWITSVGPLKVGESVRTVTQEAETLRTSLVGAQEAIEDLTLRLRRTERAVTRAVEHRNEAFRQLRVAEQRLSDRQNG